MGKYEIKHYEHNSEGYWQTVALRDEILRKPLNMKFTDEQLAAESEMIHIALDWEQDLSACLVLERKENLRMKMRQVAVREARQRQGFGSILCEYAAQVAKDEGFEVLYCHARDTAVKFYKQLGWKVVSDEFEEVGIKHYKMEKRLSLV